MTSEHFVCQYEEVPTDEFRIEEIDDMSIGFIRRDDGVHAILNYCPHQGAEICKGSVGGTIVNSDVGSYEYGLENRVLRCPWHGWEFDIETGDGIYPGHENIATFETDVRDGDIYIRL